MGYLCDDIGLALAYVPNGAIHICMSLHHLRSRNDPAIRILSPYIFWSSLMYSVLWNARVVHVLWSAALTCLTSFSLMKV